MYDEEFKLLSELSIFNTADFDISIIRIILNYKYSILSWGSMHNNCDNNGNINVNREMIDKTAWDSANDEIHRRSESCVEYQFFGSMFYFVPTLFNWDLNYIDMRLAASIYNNQQTSTQWKLYFNNKIKQYCDRYWNSNKNDTAIKESKVSQIVLKHMKSFRAAHEYFR